jgi:hypothetical protein
MYPAVLLMYFISAAVILIAYLTLLVQKFSCHILRVMTNKSTLYQKGCVL